MLKIGKRKDKQNEVPSYILQTGYKILLIMSMSDFFDVVFDNYEILLYLCSYLLFFHLEPVALYIWNETGFPDITYFLKASNLGKTLCLYQWHFLFAKLVK